MALERFPKRKYLRQVRDMEDDFATWREGYLRDAMLTPDQWWAGRLEGRAAVLEDAQYQLRKLFDTLEGLGRLR